MKFRIFLYSVFFPTRDVVKYVISMQFVRHAAGRAAGPSRMPL
jgi:hypothetical protein